MLAVTKFWCLSQWPTSETRLSDSKHEMQPGLRPVVDPPVSLTSCPLSPSVVPCLNSVSSLYQKPETCSLWHLPVSDPGLTSRFSLFFWFLRNWCSINTAAPWRRHHYHRNRNRTWTETLSRNQVTSDLWPVDWLTSGVSAVKMFLYLKIQSFSLL